MTALGLVGIACLVVSVALLVATRRRTGTDRDQLARERAHADEQLALAWRERERWLTALDAVPDGVVVVDAGGEVVFRNDAATRFQNARRGDAVAEELLGRLLERALAGEDAERELPLFGPPREVLLVRAAPLRDGARIVGAVAFVRDVTEFRRVESMRRDFVANVSHELKTPIGALALLAETIASSDDAAVMLQLSEQMVREADRVGRIVDELLDLSLIEAQEAPTREQVPARVLLEESVESVRALALAKGIAVQVEPPPDDLLIACDPGQVVSAVTNLLDNAVKYSDDGQRIDVCARRVDGRVAIEVRDTGIGIPSRDLERIFERFYRVDKARSRVTGGTGLGLSIVRHVAQAHGGEVTVTSHEGEGSTFRLLLPVPEATSRGPDAPTAGMAAAS
jgi:two-component system, OmpR family, sensor histidine kinase SenX3